MEPQRQEESVPLIDDDQVTYEGVSAKETVEFGLRFRQNELELMICGEGAKPRYLKLQRNALGTRGLDDHALIILEVEGVSSGWALEGDIVGELALEASLKVYWRCGYPNMLFRLQLGDFEFIAQPSCEDMEPWFDFRGFDISDADDVD